MTGVLAGLLCAAGWAGGSVMLKELTKKLDPLTLNAPRTLAGGLSLMLLGFVTDRFGGYRAVTPEKLFFMLASVCVGGGMGESLYIYSLSRIGVSRAFPISSTYPIFALILGFLFLHEQISLAVVAGLVLVVLGIILIGRRAANPDGDTSASARAWGMTSALSAAVSWGGATVLLAPGAEGLDSIMVAAIRTVALSLALAGIVGLRGTFRQLLQLTRKEWALLIVGGILSWGLASATYVVAVVSLGPSRAAILTSSSPLFALPLSVVFLKERPNAGVLVGTVLTIAGVILVL